MNAEAFWGQFPEIDEESEKFWAQFDDSDSQDDSFDYEQFWSQFPEGKSIFGGELSQESLPDSLKRNVSRLSADVISGIGGLPGDLAALATLGGSKLLSLTQPKEKRDEFVSTIWEGVPHLATSGEIRSALDPLIYGTGEPQNKFEELLSTVATETPGFSLGGYGSVARRVAKGGLLSSLGEGAKDTAEFLGADTDTANLAKIGTIGFSSLVRPGSMRKEYGRLYKKADDLLAKSPGSYAHIGELDQSLAQIEHQFRKGVDVKGGFARLDPEKAELLDWIDSIRSKMVGNIMPVDELRAFKRSLNRRITPLIKKGGKDVRGPLRMLKKINHDIEKSIEAYGKNNPEFLKAHKDANAIYAGIEKGNRVADTIKAAGKKVGADPKFMAFLLFSHPKAAAVGGALYTTAEALRFAERFSANPAMRRYYGKMLQAAAKEDSQAVSRYLQKLVEENEKTQ